MMVLAILFFSGCNKDDEPDPTTQQLIGVWQADQISLGASIDGVNYYQYLLNEGYTEEEANSALDLLGNLLILSYSGTVEFKSDNTYTSTLGSSVETGTWSVLNGGATLQMKANGSSDTDEIEIKSIGSTQLVLAFTDTHDDDVNDDGIDEEVITEIELTFAKSTS